MKDRGTSFILVFKYSCFTLVMEVTSGSIAFLPLSRPPIGSSESGTIQPYGDLSYKESYAETCMGWVKSLYNHHCKFIFNGHAHIYLRTKPLRPDGSVDAKNGIVHVINGTGGASFKDPSPQSPKIAYTPSGKSFQCITFVTISGNKASLETVNARPGHDLHVIDKYTTGR